MYKRQLLIYAALVAIALAGGISLRFGTYDHNRDLLVLILALIYMLLVFVMVVVTMVMIVTRFYKNLFSQEGYLMHTLPVPAWQLVAVSYTHLDVYKRQVCVPFFPSYLCRF